MTGSQPPFSAISNFVTHFNGNNIITLLSGTCESTRFFIRLTEREREIETGRQRVWDASNVWSYFSPHLINVRKCFSVPACPV